MKKICGEAGTGAGGKMPFPVKQRKEREGGDWTFNRSLEVRPQIAGSVYKRGHAAATPASNTYEPLYKAVCVGGKPPSGWDNENVIRCMLYNLRRHHEHRQEVAKAAKASRSASASSARAGGKQRAKADEEETESEEEEEEEEAGGDDTEVVEVEPVGPMDLANLEKDVSTLESVAMEDLWKYASSHEPFFLAWTKMGILGRDPPSPFLTLQPKPSLDGTDTRSAHREATKSRQQERAAAVADGTSLAGAEARAGREVTEIATRVVEAERKAIQFEIAAAREKLLLLKDMEAAPTEIQAAQRELLAALQKKPRLIPEVEQEMKAGHQGGSSSEQ